MRNGIPGDSKLNATVKCLRGLIQNIRKYKLRIYFCGVLTQFTMKFTSCTLKHIFFLIQLYRNRYPQLKYDFSAIKI